MRKVIISLGAMLSLSLSINCFAVWTSAENIETVYLHTQHNGYGVFLLSKMGDNPAKCSNPAYYVLSKENNVLFSEIYSLMLTNHVAGGKVRVWIDDSQCSPHNHPLIIHARSDKI